MKVVFRLDGMRKVKIMKDSRLCSEYFMFDPLTDGKLTKVSSYDGYIYSIRVLGKV